MQKAIFIAIVPASLVPGRALASAVFSDIPHTFVDGIMFMAICCLLTLVVALYRTCMSDRSRNRHWEELQEELGKARAALDQCRHDEQNYRDMFEMSPAGIFRSSLDGQKFMMVNRALARLYGYEDPRAFCADVKPVDVYADPGQRDELLRLLEEADGVENMELSYLDMHGNVRPMLASVKAHRAEGYLEGAVLDLTETRNVQSQLREKNRFLQALLDAMPTPLFYKDRDGLYQLCNDAFYRMLNCTAHEIIGKSVYDLSPETYARRYDEMDKALLEASGQASQRYESSVKTPSGELEVVFNKQTITDDRGEVQGLLGVITDITSQKNQARMIQEKGSMMEALLDSLKDMVFFKDVDLRYRNSNEAYARFCGWSAEELMGLSEHDLFPEEKARMFEEKDREALETLAPVQYVADVVVSGERRLLELVKTPVVTPQGDVLGVVGVARDVTERLAMEEALSEVEARYRTIFENTVEGLYISTAEGRFEEANEAMATLLGYDSRDALLAEVHDIGSQIFVRPEDRRKMLELLEKEETLVDYEVEWMRRDGSVSWFSLGVRAVRDRQGKLVRLQGIASDISLRKAAETELERRANTDPLTGLPNRSHLLLTCSRYLSLARVGGEKVGLLFLDLDGFKQINDEFGHVVGDDIIRQVAQRLRTFVSNKDIAARIGGDEFALLCWDVQDEAQLESSAMALMEMIEGDYQCGSATCFLGVSIGGSLYPNHGESMEELLAKADQAMYDVKYTGSSGYRLAE